jgi:hypothetical protein
MWKMASSVLWQERTEDILWVSDRIVFCVAKELMKVILGLMRDGCFAWLRKYWRHSLGFWENSVLRGCRNIEGILWTSEGLVFCVATEVLKAFFGHQRDWCFASLRKYYPCSTYRRLNLGNNIAGRGVKLTTPLFCVPQNTGSSFSLFTPP